MQRFHRSNAAVALKADAVDRGGIRTTVMTVFRPEVSMATLSNKPGRLLFLTRRRFQFTRANGASACDPADQEDGAVADTFLPFRSELC